jgi:D-galactarolactone cycloisomerase
MKIEDISLHQLRAEVEKPFTSSRGFWYKHKNALLVQVITDEGIDGWGECYGPANVAKSVIETLHKPQVLGRDPFDVEVIWEGLYTRIKDYGLSGMTISGMSGIDIALWDIIGKACQQPIHKLIGGCFRKVIPAYATGLYFSDLTRVVEEAVEEASQYVQTGFKAIKMKIGLGSIKEDIRRIEKVRDAIGPDIDLMVDANHCYSVHNAIKLGRELEKLGIYWFEEPTSPENIEGYVEITKKLDIAIAGGENEFTKFGFRDIIARHAMDIVQPDVCAAGGITECKKIGTLANAFGIECIPHAWGSIVGMAATLHFIAALPDCPPALFPIPPMLEYEKTYNPFRDELGVEPIVQKDGVVSVPTGPGLGIQIRKDVLEKYRVK